MLQHAYLFHYAVATGLGAALIDLKVISFAKICMKLAGKYSLCEKIYLHQWSTSRLELIKALEPDNLCSFAQLIDL